jgi:hypothetical protein
MTDPNSLYGELRYWLVWVSAFGVVIKAYLTGKRGVQEFVDKLLNNHLAGIESATVSTEKETKTTNSLLKDSMGKIDMVQSTLQEQQTKNLQVWRAVTENLTILRERTCACNPSRKASAKRKK